MIRANLRKQPFFSGKVIAGEEEDWRGRDGYSIKLM